MTRVLTDELSQIGETLLRDGHVYHGNIVHEAGLVINQLRAALRHANAEWRSRLHEYEYDPEALLASEDLVNR